MDSQTPEKKPKTPAKPSAFAALRVRKETRKYALQLLAKANRKDFGNKIPMDPIVTLGLSLIRLEHIQELQEGSLSNADRLDRDYRTYIGKHGVIDKDTYLGKRLAGEIAANTSVGDAKKAENSA